MTIVLTGGGSGGHITPILAVAKELKKLHPSVKIVYIGLKGDVLGDVVSDKPDIDEAYYVRAGKFRRYHSSGIKQIFDFKTQFLNLRDFFYVFIGLIQSYKLMKKIKPDIVFSRGGFVIVPVCLAAKLNSVPYITHDSDSIPSLANKITARWAKMHFVALPEDTYPYKKDATVTTGIPLSSSFKPVTDKLKSEYRKKLDITSNAKMLLIIGGGLGAVSLNDAVLDVAPNLIGEFPSLEVVHISGRDNYTAVKDKYDQESLESVKVIGFSDEVYLYSGAADLVVTRAGATNLAEFAVQGKACIVIPSSYLVSGHQLHNAKFLEDAGAIQVITDIQLKEDPNRLAKKISHLLKNPSEIKKMETAIASLAKPNAAEDIAVRLLKIVEKDV